MKVYFDNEQGIPVDSRGCPTKCLHCGISKLEQTGIGVCKQYCQTCRSARTNKRKSDYWFSSRKFTRSRDQEYSANTRRREKLKLDDQLRLYFRSKASAQTRGIEFSISKEDIVIPEHCPVLLTPFEYNTEQTMSVDRIDNSKGYIPGNIQIISRRANTMKNSASREDLINFAHWVLDTFGDKP